MSATALMGQEAADVMRTAEIAGVSPQVRQLEQMGTEPARSWERLALHQAIYEKVLAASLRTDATVAQMDNEIAQCNELRGYLADRRDKLVNRTNLWSVLLGGGLGAASSGLQLPSSGQPRAAAVTGIAAGTVSAGLAATGIRAQRGGTRVLEFRSNMLAKLFDRPVLEDSEYEAVTWRFLSEIAPTDPDRLTRRERLIRTWTSLKQIDELGTAAGRMKVERVTSEPSQKLALTIDDLEDRAAMLQDVRAKLSFLKRDLAALVAALPEL